MESKEFHLACPYPLRVSTRSDDIHSTNRKFYREYLADRPAQWKILCCGIEVTSLRMEVPGNAGERSFEPLHCRVSKDCGRNHTTRSVVTSSATKWSNSSLRYMHSSALCSAQTTISPPKMLIFTLESIVYSGEFRIHNLKAGGSIPPPATISSIIQGLRTKRKIKLARIAEVFQKLRLARSKHSKTLKFF